MTPWIRLGSSDDDHHGVMSTIKYRLKKNPAAQEFCGGQKKPNRWWTGDTLLYFLSTCLSSTCLQEQHVLRLWFLFNPFMSRIFSVFWLYHCREMYYYYYYWCNIRPWSLRFWILKILKIFCITYAILSMSILSSKAQLCKDFWKSYKSCHVGIHWIVRAEYSQMSTHLPGFQSFFRFFASFCIGQISL